MQIVTLQEAKAKKLNKYFTGKPCVKGHVSERYTNRSACVECSILRAKTQLSTPEAKAAKAIYDKEYRIKNIDEIKAKKKIRSKQYRQDNKAKLLADTKWRKLSIRKATPKWADRKKISEFYIKSTKLTEKTGIQHSVDHIIPINGKTVCGLHVENNLRVIPLADNVRKLNKFDEQILRETGIY